VRVRALFADIRVLEGFTKVEDEEGELFCPMVATASLELLLECYLDCKSARLWRWGLFRAELGSQFHKECEEPLLRHAVSLRCASTSRVLEGRKGALFLFPECWKVRS